MEAGSCLETERQREGGCTETETRQAFDPYQPLLTLLQETRPFSLRRQYTCDGFKSQLTLTDLPICYTLSTIITKVKIPKLEFHPNLPPAAPATLFCP